MDDLNSLINIVLEKERQNTGNQTVYFLNESEIINNYETYDTLIDIYSNVQNDQSKKDEFINSLTFAIQHNEFIEYSEYAGDAHLAVFTLIKLGFTKKVVEELKKRKSPTILIPVVLNALIKDDFKYFDDNDLEEIKKFFINQLKIFEGKDYTDNLQNAIGEFASNIVKIRFENLKKSVKSINLEINLDKKTVSSKLSYLGFDSKFTGLLNEIDLFINSDTSIYVNSAMIGNLRVFMEDIFKDVANKIANHSNEEIPKIKDRSEMGNVRAYLKIKLELHENEDKFINNFINILHTEGGHSFTSEKEYFRLARNIAIELALLLLSKYEKNFTSSNN